MMRRNWRSNRGAFLLVLLLICGAMILASVIDLADPLEDIIGAPIRAVTQAITGASRIAADVGQPDTVEALRERNAELERQLANLYAEVIQLREISSDYRRLTALLDYTSSIENREWITADVIGVDQDSTVRSIIINRGTRDGIAVGMPVETELGLVGRVMAVTANAAQVQLISDQGSSISARLQTSRAEGSVQGRGLLTGNLRMLYIDLDAEVIEGDLVVTSGLGGNFPPDIVIGQVTSRRNFEFELYQEAEVRSLIDFSKLEFVLVITSFEPADLSTFEEPGT